MRVGVGAARYLHAQATEVRAARLSMTASVSAETRTICLTCYSVFQNDIGPVGAAAINDVLCASTTLRRLKYGGAARCRRCCVGVSTACCV